MRGSRLAIGLGGLVVLLCLVGAGLQLVRVEQGQGLELFVLALAISAYGAVGALIASQAPRNPVGWLIASGALAVAQFLVAAGILLSAGPGPVPAGWPRLLAWVIVLIPLPVAPACLVLALLYFPDGHLANRRFRPVVWTVVGGSLLLLLSYLAHPEELGLREAGLRSLGWALELPFVDGYAGAWSVSMVLGSVAVLVSLLVRRRRGLEEDRRPLRWLLRMLVSLVALVAGAFAAGALLEGTVDTWFVFIFFFFFGAAILLFGIPMAITVGVLKYRVYEIDLSIRRSILGKVMVAFVVLAFLAVLALPLSILGGSLRLGSGLPAWAAIPAFLLGLSFGPVRRWARRGADRILYGERATPYEVLSEFSERVGETYSVDDVLPRMAQLLAAGTGASEARVWLRVGDELRPIAAWPPDAASADPIPSPGDELPRFSEGSAVVPVRHQGELFGALTLEMHADDPMNPAKEQLTRELASQAGLVLRNVRLLEELQDSRRRIVTAQDERARTLERNIHDGAQQQLVALAVKLGLVERMVEKDPPKAATMLAEAKAETGEALENLRDLARGIYPPLLAEEGLGSALLAQARRSAVPVTVESDGIGRYAREIESAVYFCCLEALQNVAKYADASKVSVQIAQRNGELTFEVSDDGRGFDPTAAQRGSGLQGIADRLAALGGELVLRSAPGEGTTICGNVPVEGQR